MIFVLFVYFFTSDDFFFSVLISVHNPLFLKSFDDDDDDVVFLPRCLFVKCRNTNGVKARIGKQKQKN